MVDIAYHAGQSDICHADRSVHVDAYGATDSYFYVYLVKPPIYLLMLCY